MAQPQTIQVSSIMKPNLSRRKKEYLYAIQMADPGAPTYPNGGIVVNISRSNVLNPLAVERAAWSDPSLPQNYEIEQYNQPSGYVLALLQNPAAPTMQNFCLHIYTAEGTELAANANIPAALFAAVLANAPQLIFRLRGKVYA